MTHRLLTVTLAVLVAALVLIAFRAPSRVAPPAPEIASPALDDDAPAMLAVASDPTLPEPASSAVTGAAESMAGESAAPAPTASAAAPVRAAYFYSYMPPAHLDSLAAHGLGRALAHTVGDSLDARSRGEFKGLANRADSLGIELVPEWLFQSAPRLASRPTARRYTWGHGTVEPEVACPLDSAYWRSALFDRAEELLALLPGTRRLALDLELYRAGRHHYDIGACGCSYCVGEYTASAPELRGRPAWELSGLETWEEARLRAILTPMLAGFARRHPGVQLEVFDLDLDSFVHRALGRALANAKVGTTDYTERSYTLGAAAIPAARARLDQIGQGAAPLVGGLWLKRWTPSSLPAAMRAIDAHAQGVFVFTTYSLWLDPTRLTGAYTLQGTAAQYWAALARGSAP